MERTYDIVEFETLPDPSKYNLTYAYNVLEVGAYSDLFAYEFCLVVALLLGLYFNVRFIRACRFHLMFLWEMIACALGISGFHAFAAAVPPQTPTHIAYSALVLIVVNLAFSLVDMILCFKNRALHTLHLLVASAALWIGCIATTAWYRDSLQNNGYNDIWVFSFICMWGGAMIAVPIPGVVNYLLFFEGPYNPAWVAVDPAERIRAQEKAKKKAEKDAAEKEKEPKKKDKDKDKDGAKKEKGKKREDSKGDEIEMGITDKEFITVHVHKSENEDSDDDDSDGAKKKKKRSRKGKKKDKDKDKDKEEVKEMVKSKKDKDKDKDKDKGKKDKDKAKKDKDKDKDKDRDSEKAKKKKKRRKPSSDDDDSD